MDYGGSGITHSNEEPGSEGMVVMMKRSVAALKGQPLSAPGNCHLGKQFKDGKSSLARDLLSCLIYSLSMCFYSLLFLSWLHPPFSESLRCRPLGLSFLGLSYATLHFFSSYISLQVLPGSWAWVFGDILPQSYDSFPGA